MPVKWRVKLAYLHCPKHLRVQKNTYLPLHSSVSRERTASYSTGRVAKYLLRTKRDIKMHKRFWLERFKEKDNLENLGVDTKSRLKQILQDLCEEDQ